MEFGQLEGVAIVPDPYRGEAKDFEHVLDLLEDACEGLIRHLQSWPGWSATPYWKHLLCQIDAARDTHPAHGVVAD